MEAAVTETELKQIGLSLPTMRIITGDSQLYGQVRQSSIMISLLIFIEYGKSNSIEMS